MIFLFAVAAGSAVGNLYWAQPLLTDISAALDFPLAASGSLITVTQLGYALGVLLLVPLGDALDRRRLIPAVMTMAALALFACALAPNYTILLGTLAAVGLTTVSGHLLLPLAGDLARDDQRGHVIGSIAAGALTGILLSRTISGLLADLFGWRSIYLVAALVTLGLAGLLAFRLPADRQRTRMSYGVLLLSIATTVARNRPIQVTLLLGACGFSVFTMFWTGLTFLLSSPAYSYSVMQIGLVGLVGLAGALAARRAGLLHDRGLSVPATGSALGLTLVSIGIAAAGGSSIWMLLLAVLLIDIALQGASVLNHTRLFSLAPEARSRLNTAFVVCNFTGGAVTSTLAGYLWATGGWYLLLAGQAAITLLGLIVWAFNRETLAAS
jgi:predicted MFS family arabinose efflux permease